MAALAVKGKKLWHRMPGEGQKVYELLLAYLELGSIRSAAKVAEVCGRSVELCSTMCWKYDWVERARAYDDYLIQIQETAIENQLQKDAIVYAKRRSVYREKEYTLASSLLAQAEEMLNAPLYETVVTKTETIAGKEVAVAVTMIPAKWSKATAHQMAKVAAEIMRLHLEMETSIAKVNINMEDPNVRLRMAQASLLKLQDSVEQLVDEQLAANPNLDRAQTRLSILEQLPKWVSIDWKLPPEMTPLLQLTSGNEEVLPLSPTEIQEVM